MNTFTLFFPNKLRPKLMIEVFADGTVFSCVRYDADLKDWVSCTEGILNPEIRAAINEDVQALRWEYQHNSVGDLFEALRPA